MFCTSPPRWYISMYVGISPVMIPLIHEAICALRICLLLIPKPMHVYILYVYISCCSFWAWLFFYSWAVLSLLASHILPTDLSVCDPSLLHQIAAQAYVCTLIQPCSTNLYTYACLLPHVLVFIPWGIHMHGSIAACCLVVPFAVCVRCLLCMSYAHCLCLGPS